MSFASKYLKGVIYLRNSSFLSRSIAADTKNVKKRSEADFGAATDGFLLVAAKNVPTSRKIICMMNMAHIRVKISLVIFSPLPKRFIAAMEDASAARFRTARFTKAELSF